MQAKRKLNIVYWAFPSWNGDYMKSTVELAKELAVKHRVLYIDYAYTLKDVLTAKSKPFMPVKRITGQAESLQEVKLENGGTIYVLSLPPIIPFNWAGNKTIYEILEGLNSTIVAGRVKRALKKIDFDTDVVVNAFNPFFGKATKKVFAGKPVLYYCYDNIDAAAWAAKHGARLEKDFMCSVDGVIFSSDALLENKASRAPKFVVKNGVDLRAFGEIKPTTSPGKNKVIGYTGTVDDRLDFELLENMIKAKPGFEFRFIGRVITPKAEALKKYSNVKFYGPVEPPTLPAMMKD
ncbi:MAG TPA: hypothetical protein VG603_11645, partial [Chitinophagales bacterium]|nr:hypothetical protein [Chitinophagales bacterium]